MSVGQFFQSLCNHNKKNQAHPFLPGYTVVQLYRWPLRKQRFRPSTIYLCVHRGVVLIYQDSICFLMVIHDCTTKPPKTRRDEDCFCDICTQKATYCLCFLWNSTLWPGLNAWVAGIDFWNCWTRRFWSRLFYPKYRSIFLTICENIFKKFPQRLNLANKIYKYIDTVVIVKFCIYNAFNFRKRCTVGITNMCVCLFKIKRNAVPCLYRVAVSFFAVIMVRNTFKHNHVTRSCVQNSRLEIVLFALTQL